MWRKQQLFIVMGIETHLKKIIKCFLFLADIELNIIWVGHWNMKKNKVEKRLWEYDDYFSVFLHWRNDITGHTHWLRQTSDIVGANQEKILRKKMNLKIRRIEIRKNPMHIFA